MKRNGRICDLTYPFSYCLEQASCNKEIGSKLVLNKHWLLTICFSAFASSELLFKRLEPFFRKRIELT